MNNYIETLAVIIGRDTPTDFEKILFWVLVILLIIVICLTKDEK